MNATPAALPQEKTEVEDSSDVRDAAILSFGHAAAMVFGGVLAVLIAHYFGKSARTDAFFAAYGVYTVALVFGQTFRLTALPRLVVDPDGEVPDRMLASIILISVLAAIPMVVLAEPFGDLLVAHGARHVAPDSLRSLWPAVAGQLLIGLLAAILVVRGLFGVIGIGYAAGGLISIAAVMLFHGPLGIQAVPLGLAGSSFSLALLFLATLARRGWRPRLRIMARLRPVLSESRSLLLGSASFVAANLGFVVCLAIASREGTGAVTIYSYAYFGAALLVSTTAISSAMVRAPKLLSGGSASEIAPANVVSTFRFTLVLVLPVLGAAALIGGPIISFVLGHAFTDADGWRVVTTLLLLSGWIVASAAGVFAIIHLLAHRRAGALAVLAAFQVLLLPFLAIAGRELAGIAGIAAAQSLILLATTLLQLRLAFGEEFRSTVLQMSRALARGLLAIGAAFAPGATLLLVAGVRPLVAVAAAMMSLALVLVASRHAWPAESEVLLSVVSRRYAGS